MEDKAVKALAAFERLRDALFFYEELIYDLPLCVNIEVDWNDVKIVREALDQLKDKR